MPKKPAAPQRSVDPASLKIGNDPLPGSRVIADHKYDDLFSKMKFGQCLICESADAGKIGHAMNTWLKRSKGVGIVRTTKHYPADGKGRVWLLEPVKKLKVA